MADANFGNVGKGHSGCDSDYSVVTISAIFPRVIIQQCGTGRPQSLGRFSGPVAGPAGHQCCGYQGGAEDADPEAELSGDVADELAADEVVCNAP